jgi:hypothetical protein
LLKNGRDGIVSAVVPWLAAADSFGPEENTAYDSVTLYRFVRVRAAGRIKTAEPGMEQLSHEPMLKREGLLVEAYQ